MGALVFKGVVYVVIAVNYEDTLRELFMFKSYGPIGIAQFRCPTQFDSDFAVSEGPATWVRRRFGGTYSK